jgi:plastocyanin
MNRKQRFHRRRGSVLVYSTVLLVVFLAMVSLGMDYAHCQSVKTEEQRSADLTARGLLQMYTTWGSSTVAAYATVMAGLNGVDGKYAAPTPTITWGTYNPATNVFTANASSTTAVKVTIARTAAAGNPVKLIFPLLTANGRNPIKTTVDISSTAIAYFSTSATTTVSGQADPWLAGMPSGSASVSDGDTAPNQSPNMAVQVNPGDTITFTNVTANNGGVNHDPSLSPDGPNGNTSQIYSHNCDDPRGEPAVQNNIGDIKAPIDSLIGVFLKNSEPTANTAPTTVLDYSTQSARDTVSNTTLQNQQPFFIGTGQTSGGTTKTFTVPAGCTRLYLGVMDGHQWNNNGGSFGVTVNHGNEIKLVQ